jgi:hypothetical protein
VTVCKRLALLLMSLVLMSCAVTPGNRDPVQPSRFEFDDLAKADVDMVAEINVSHSLTYLNELARKLYVRNPRQLARAGYDSRDDALRDLSRAHFRRFDEALQGRRSTDALMVAFSDEYAGDRVAAFIIGMRTMLLDGYGGKTEFYLHHALDPQKLYYLARNFEIAFWKLGHDRGADGELLLLSNSLQGTGDLSFERIAGKLIGLQDHMAQVIADSSNRQIKNVVQSVASAVFFPI